MRRQFQLREDDEAALRSRSLGWESIIVASDARWILIPGYPIFPGYNHAQATAAVRLPPTYPDTQIDMVYFYPHLARADGKPVQALTPHEVDGRSFQQWSRHRVAQNPWRPGLDDLGTHLLMVDDWLEREFKLR